MTGFEREKNSAVEEGTRNMNAFKGCVVNMHVVLSNLDVSTHKSILFYDAQRTQQSTLCKWPLNSTCKKSDCI